MKKSKIINFLVCLTLIFLACFSVNAKDSSENNINVGTNELLESTNIDINAILFRNRVRKAIASLSEGNADYYFINIITGEDATCDVLSNYQNSHLTFESLINWLNDNHIAVVALINDTNSTSSPNYCDGCPGDSYIVVNKSKSNKHKYTITKYVDYPITYEAIVTFSGQYHIDSKGAFKGWIKSSGNIEQDPGSTYSFDHVYTNNVRFEFYDSSKKATAYYSLHYNRADDDFGIGNYTQYIATSSITLSVGG